MMHHYMIIQNYDDTSVYAMPESRSPTAPVAYNSILSYTIIYMPDYTFI